MPTQNEITIKKRLKISQEIRKRLIEEGLTEFNDFLSIYTHAPRILELIGLKPENYTITTFWTYDGKLQLPEVVGNGSIQLQIWNSGGHYEPIY